MKPILTKEQEIKLAQAIFGKEKCTSQNAKFVEALEETDVSILSNGLSAMLKRSVPPDKAILTQTLEQISDIYGGTGLISVLSYFLNHY